MRKLFYLKKTTKKSRIYSQVCAFRKYKNKKKLKYSVTTFTEKLILIKEIRLQNKILYHLRSDLFLRIEKSETSYKRLYQNNLNRATPRLANKIA